MYLDKYNADQKMVMAVMAYYCFSLYCETPDRETIKCNEFRNKIAGVSHAAAMIGVIDRDLWEIRRGNIKGLQNLNRIATVVFFEDNYPFDQYLEYGSLYYRTSQAATN